MEPIETTPERLIAMLLSGWSSTNATDKMATILVYARTVRTFSIGSIQEAVDRFLAGEVASHKPQFAPSCPEFALEVRRREELRAMRAALAARPKLAEPKEPVFTEEHRARIGGLMLEWAEAFAAGPEALAKFIRKRKIKPFQKHRPGEQTRHRSRQC